MPSQQFSLLDQRVCQLGPMPALGLSAGVQYWPSFTSYPCTLVLRVKCQDMLGFGGTDASSGLTTYIDPVVGGTNTPAFVLGTKFSANSTFSFFNGENVSGSAIAVFTNAHPETLPADGWHDVVIYNAFSHMYLREPIILVGSDPQLAYCTIVNYLPNGSTTVSGGCQVATTNSSLAGAGIVLDPTQDWTLNSSAGTKPAILATSPTPSDGTLPPTVCCGQRLRFKTQANATAASWWGDPVQGSYYVYVDGTKVADLSPTLAADGFLKKITGITQTADLFKLCDVPQDGNKHTVTVRFYGVTGNPLSAQNPHIAYVCVGGGTGVTGVDTSWAGDGAGAILIIGNSLISGVSAGDTHSANWPVIQLYDLMGGTNPIIVRGVSGTYVDTADDSYGGTGNGNVRAPHLAAMIAASLTAGNTPIIAVLVVYGTNDWADGPGKIAAALGGSPTDTQYKVRFLAQYQMFMTALVNSNTTIPFVFFSMPPRGALNGRGGVAIGPNLPTGTDAPSYNNYVSYISAAVTAWKAGNGNPKNVRFQNIDAAGDGQYTILQEDPTTHLFVDTRPSADTYGDKLHWYTPSGGLRGAQHLLAGMTVATQLLRSVIKPVTAPNYRTYFE